MSLKIKSLFQLDGKVIVITGASGLLGSKFSEAIAAYGGIPVLVDINEKGNRDLSDLIEKKYKLSAPVFNIDITDEDAVQDSANELIDKYGKIDALVNNAANNPKIEESNEQNFSRIENFSLNIWEQDLNIGLTGAFICSKHFGKKISENPEGGVIINISSDLGLIGPDQRLYKQENLPPDLQPVKPVSYSVVKTGIIGLTKYLATYWIDKGIRCNAICPGGVKTNQDEVFIKKLENVIPLGRMAASDEYQGALIFLLSDASSYMNGSTLVIDGGRTAW